MARWTIYCHMHIASGRRYVGLTKFTVKHRWNQHCSQAKKSAGRSHFANAILKHGKDAFSHEILATCDSLEAANAAEERLIEELGTRDPARGFNLMKGGAHTPHTFSNPWDRPEYRKTMENHVLPKLIAAGCSPESQAKSKATLNSPEVREKCAAAQRGKVMSELHRSKIAANMASIQRSKAPEELSSTSRKMTEGRRERKNMMTDAEREAVRLRHSNASRIANTAVHLHSPESVARHRRACAAKALLDVDKVQFALRLLGSGFSCNDVGWLLKVSKDVVRRYLRRSKHPVPLLDV